MDADNSHGTTLVRDPSGYGAALESAFEHSPVALVEDYVELGREVRAGVLAYENELLCLPLEEYAIDADTGVRGYADKIIDGADGGLGFAAKSGGRSWIVDPSDPITGPVQRAALACHRALGCRDYGLFDFRVDPAGRPYFLEAGLYCSFSPASVLVAMAAAAGITLPDLLGTAIDQARRRPSPR